MIDAHPREYRELDAELKEFSRLGKSGNETVDFNYIDQSTTEQLGSLGYVSGFSARKVELDGKGPDPKDEVAMLKSMETIGGPGSNKIDSARKIAMLEQMLQEDPTDPTLYYLLVDLDEKVGQIRRPCRCAWMP